MPDMGLVPSGSEMGSGKGGSRWQLRLWGYFYILFSNSNL